MNSFIRLLLSLFLGICAFSAFAQNLGGTGSGDSKVSLLSSGLSGNSLQANWFFGGTGRGDSVSKARSLNMVGSTVSAIWFFGGSGRGDSLSKARSLNMAGTSTAAIWFFGGSGRGDSVSRGSSRNMAGTAINATWFYGGIGRGDSVGSGRSSILLGVITPAVWFYGGNGRGDFKDTVKKIYLSPVEITANPIPADTICQGGTGTALSVSAIYGRPNLLYQWQYSANNSSWSNVSNGTPAGATYTNATAASGFAVSGISTAGTYFYRAQVRASDTVCCPAASTSSRLVVLADPSITSQPANAGTVCAGGNASFSYSAAGGYPTLTHQWQYSANGSSGWANVSNGSPTGAVYSGQTTSALNITDAGSVAGTHYYRSLVGAGGSGCGTVSTGVVNLIVAADPFISSASFSNDTICPGSSETTTLTAGGGISSLSYQWQIEQSGQWSNVANQTPAGFSYANAATAAMTVNTQINAAFGTFAYRCLVSSSGNGCGTAVSSSLSLSSIPSVWLGLSSNGLDTKNWLGGCLPSSGSRVEVDSSAAYPLPVTQNTTYSVLRFHGAGKPVVLGDYDLSVEDSIIGADSLNYVKTSGTGKLCMSVNAGSLRKFPVGRKAYNPVEITNNTGSSDNFCIRVLDEVYSGGTTGNVLSSDPRIMRTWDIDKGNGTANAGSGIDFKFWWNTSEDTLNPTTFYLSHYDGIVWNQLPGTVSMNGRCLSYTGYMGSFSPFAINGNQALPVSWLYVKGECKDQKALIEWATATEINNSHFEIEGSEDGRVWNSVARVEGAGNSSEIRRYVQEVRADYPYYRVMQEDYDLSRDYSDVVYLPCRTESPASVLIYPNPSTGLFHVMGVEKVKRYRLVNAIGITLRLEDHDGSERFSLDLQQLERGLYYLRLEDETLEQVHRLVLQ